MRQCTCQTNGYWWKVRANSNCMNSDSWTVMLWCVCTKALCRAHYGQCVYKQTFKATLSHWILQWNGCAIQKNLMLSIWAAVRTSNQSCISQFACIELFCTIIHANLLGCTCQKSWYIHNHMFHWHDFPAGVVHKDIIALLLPIAAASTVGRTWSPSVLQSQLSLQAVHWQATDKHGAFIPRLQKLFVHSNKKTSGWR